MALTVTVEELRLMGVSADSVSDAAAELMIKDATSLAMSIAPGLKTADQYALDAAAAIVRGAVVRRCESTGNSSGGVSSETSTAGPFMEQRSYRAPSATFFPSEEKALKQIADEGRNKAFMVDLSGADQDRRSGWTTGLRDVDPDHDVWWWADGQRY